MALPVDRAQSNAMNLQVLKRQDESVVDIVDMASHVVVYEFDQTVQSWVRPTAARPWKPCISFPPAVLWYR
jgi:hypothetical protein